MQKAVYSAVIASLAFTFVMIGAPAPVLADGVDKKCLCRFQGQRYQIGEYACIRSKLARCEMFLNNTTWTFLDDSCGSVKLERMPKSTRASTFAALPQSN